MIIIPAIDVIGGACVRLRQGSYDDTTVYNDDPVTVAKRFVDAGAGRIHLVDLDAAAGRGDNRKTFERVRHAVSCVLELGGGIRSLEGIRKALELGMDYAIVGTVLAQEPDAVGQWAADYGSRMIASIDARDGKVQIAGWQEKTGIDPVELAAAAGKMGCAAVQYTNIARDGMLTGPDIAGTLRIAQATSIPVILSGGISATSDIDTIRMESNGRIAGVIVGRALYEGRFNLADAIRRTAGREG